MDSREDNIKKDVKKSNKTVIIIIMLFIIIALVSVCVYLGFKLNKKSDENTNELNEIKNETIYIGKNKLTDNKVDNNRADDNKANNNKVDSNKVNSNKVNSNKVNSNKVNSNKVNSNNVYDNKNDDSKNDDSKSTDSKEYTEQELAQMALDYYEAKTGYRPGKVATEKNEEGKIVIQLYDSFEDHNSTSDWYTIDPKTAKGTNVLEENIDLSKFAK